MIYAIDKDDYISLGPLLNKDSLNDVPYHPDIWWTSRPGHISPLAYAVGQDSKKCIGLLLHNGANPDGWDSFRDMTALGIAVFHRKNDVAKILINYGAKTTGINMYDGESLVCWLTPELNLVREEYIKWKLQNYNTALLILCAKIYNCSQTFDKIDYNVVIKIAKYLRLACHKTDD